MQVLTRAVFTAVLIHAKKKKKKKKKKKRVKFIHFSIVYKLRNREPEKRRND